MDRRMVTAAKPVYSVWFLNKREKEWKQDDTLEWTCTGTASQRASGWRTGETT
jgi:hypothetical protein